MQTLLEKTRSGKITRSIQQVAREEGADPELLRKRIAQGSVVILKNKKIASSHPVGIGDGMRIKVNANIGVSDSDGSLTEIIEKLKCAITNCADTIMDLTISGDMDSIRKTVIKNSHLPVGTCPVYQVFGESIASGHGVTAVTEEDFFRVIEKHAKDGVAFMGLHCALTLDGLRNVGNRYIPIVSRGGGLLYCWMKYHNKENPLYKNFDTVLRIFKRYDVVLDISDCLRPGCLHDANDFAHIDEMQIVGQLVERSRRAGVSVMTEGPGHVPANQIEPTIKMQKIIHHHAPMYLLGPCLERDVSISLGMNANMYSMDQVEHTGCCLGQFLIDYLRDKLPSGNNYFEKKIQAIESEGVGDIKSAFRGLRFHWQTEGGGIATMSNDEFITFLLGRRLKLKETVEKWFNAGMPRIKS